MVLQARRTYPIPDILEMFHVRFSVNCMFSVSLRAKYAGLLLSINVQAIPEEACANVIWPFERILARIKKIKNVLAVPPGASKK